MTKDKISKVEWAFNNATVNFIKGQQVKSECTAELVINEQFNIEWTAIQICLTTTNNLKNRVLLDSGASTSIFAI